MDVKTFPLLIVGTAKGATASTAKYFNLLHETLPPNMYLESGLCSGLVDVDIRTGIWHSTLDGRIIGKPLVVLALMRHFDNHVKSLYANRQYLHNWYHYGVNMKFTRNPSRAAIKTFLIRRNKRLQEVCDRVIWADIDIPLRLK